MATTNSSIDRIQTRGKTPRRKPHPTGDPRRKRWRKAKRDGGGTDARRGYVTGCDRARQNRASGALGPAAIMDHKHAILSPAMAPPGKHAIQPINCSFSLFLASRSYITPMAANPPSPFLLTSPAPEARQEDPVGRLERLAAAGFPPPDPPTLTPFSFRAHTTKSGDRTSQ